MTPRCEQDPTDARKIAWNAPAPHFDPRPTIPACTGKRAATLGGTRLTGFEPVTFGFLARSNHSAGLRGARSQAVSATSRSAEIGWNLWDMLPHSLPRDHERRWPIPLWHDQPREG